MVTRPEMLRTLRMGYGMSVQQLAMAVGVSRMTVQSWEQGHHGSERGIYRTHALALLRALHLDPKHPDLIGRFVISPGRSAHVPAPSRGNRAAPH